MAYERNANELKRVAYHEAGHAVAAVVLHPGLLECVTVDPEYRHTVNKMETLLSHEIVGAAFYNPAKVSAGVYVLVAFAGEETEKFFVPEAYDPSSSNSDRILAKNVLRSTYLNLPLVSTYFVKRAERKLRHATELMVRDLESGIHAVAQALMERTTLTSSEVEILLTKEITLDELGIR